MNPIEANPAQTISYQLTRKDIIHVWRRRFLKYYSMRALICLIAAALFYGSGFHYLSFLTIAIFLFAIYLILNKAPTNTNPITLTYTSVGFLQVGSDYRIEIPWSGCKAISEDALYFYLQMTKNNITIKIIPKSAFSPQQIEEFRRCTQTVKETPEKQIPAETLANRYGTDTSSRCDAPLNSVRNQAALPPIPISAPRRRRTGRIVILILGVCLVVYVAAKVVMTGYSFYSWVKQFTEIHFTSY